MPEKSPVTDGNWIDLVDTMDAPRQSDQFPCPFCHSGSLLVIGGSRRFHYYRCGDCAEIWTVTDTWGHRDASQPANRLPLMH